MYNNIVATKGVINIATKKIGRPTDSLKEYMLRVRMDDELLQKLDECCDKKELSRSDLVRVLIRKEYEELENHKRK